MTTTVTGWEVYDAQWIDTDDTCDVIVIALGANGKRYAVSCSGPKGMRSDDFIPAVRAACAVMIGAVGGDMSVVGGMRLDLFDTGDQRAS